MVVLTNRGSFSAANDFALIMKAFPYVKLIGDRTGGGGGFPINSELPNGWTYRFSSNLTLSPDSFNVENGIPPDIKVDLKKSDEDIGIDTIIEEALKFILNS